MTGVQTCALPIWSFSTYQPLAAGVHTFTVQAAGAGIGSNALVGGDATTVNQGELTVAIVNL